MRLSKCVTTLLVIMPRGMSEINFQSPVIWEPQTRCCQFFSDGLKEKVRGRLILQTRALAEMTCIGLYQVFQESRHTARPRYSLLHLPCVCSESTVCQCQHPVKGREQEVEQNISHRRSLCMYLMQFGRGTCIHARTRGRKSATLLRSLKLLTRALKRAGEQSEKEPDWTQAFLATWLRLMATSSLPWDHSSKPLRWGSLPRQPGAIRPLPMFSKLPAFLLLILT